ncbi:MAG TPA: hypothetical protein VJ576_13625 [Rhodocyclaceae bacterium]|nr:hypothetical protein [Rhodocyclaceae bacterium]
MAKQFTRLFIALVAAHWVGGAVAEDRHPMHHHFPQDVDAFHSVLAPIWHARPGKERSRNACAKAAEMEGLAKDIRSADAAQLVASVATLKQKCQGGDAEVDAALFDVHEAFHRLIEPRPAAAGR